MNNVLLVGRLTQDSELFEFNNGEGKAIKFTLAVKRRTKNSSDGKDADFIPVIYFADFAQKLEEYLTKGKLISVSGKIRIQSVEGKDGAKMYFTNIVADNIEFLSSNKKAL